jgi:hypothetical protein
MGIKILGIEKPILLLIPAAKTTVENLLMALTVSTHAQLNPSQKGLVKELSKELKNNERITRNGTKTFSLNR